MLQVLQLSSPTPLLAAILRLPTAHTFGGSAGATPLLPGPPAQPQSARQLADSCPECCTSASEQMMKPPAAPAAPAARLPTALCRLPGLYSSDPLRLPTQSAAAYHCVLHCTPL